MALTGAKVYLFLLSALCACFFISMPILCCRSFESLSTSNGLVSDDILTQLEEATDVANIMEELGYGCTIDVSHCKDILSFFSPLKEETVSKIISMVVRTHTGLEDAHGTHSTFYTSMFNSSITDSSWLSSWNIDVLLDSIKQLVSVLPFTSSQSLYSVSCIC